MQEPSNFGYRLWQMFSNTCYLVNKVRQKELYQRGTSLRYTAIMHAILRLGMNATPIEIARQASRERHSISEQISRMEKEGLVRKIRDLKRKNLVRVELTEKGYALFQETVNRESIEYIMMELTWEEKQEFWSFLVRLRRKTAEYLDIEDNNLFPPSDVGELSPVDTDYRINL